MNLKTKLFFNRWAAYLVPSYPLHICGKYGLSVVVALITMTSSVLIIVFRTEIALLTVGSIAGLKWLCILTVLFIILLEPWIWVVRKWIKQNDAEGDTHVQGNFRTLSNMGHILSLVISFVAAILFFFALKSEFRITYSTDIDMKPGIVSGKKFVMKYAKGDIYEVNDVIAFLNPATGKRILVKRLVGLPGDEVQFKGGVFENSNKLRHRYVDQKDSKKIENFDTIVLKEDCYMVLGDDILNSQEDSLTFGCVPRKNLFGKVLYNLDGTMPIPLKNELD